MTAAAMHHNPSVTVRDAVSYSVPGMQKRIYLFLRYLQEQQTSQSKW